MKSHFKTQIELTEKLMVALPWEDRGFYASYLAQTFHFVSHSTRLLAYAGGLARVNDDRTHRHFTAHISEEKGHDKLALNDMKALGLAEPQEAFGATRNLYETQFYKIQFIHPLVLHSYILALEGVASLICPKILSRITKSHGVNAVRFLKLHVEEDPGHVELAFAEIEKIDSQLQKPLLENLHQSFENYRVFLQAILENHLAENLVKPDLSFRSSEPAIQRSAQH